MPSTQLVKAAKTAAFTSAAIELEESLDVTLQIKTSGAGATPTVTVKLQGSHDEVNWNDLATVAITTNTVTMLKKTAGDHARFYRVDLSLFTNIQVDSVYISGN